MGGVNDMHAQYWHTHLRRTLLISVSHQPRQAIVCCNKAHFCKAAKSDTTHRHFAISQNHTQLLTYLPSNLPLSCGEVSSFTQDRYAARVSGQKLQLVDS